MRVLPAPTIPLLPAESRAIDTILKLPHFAAKHRHLSSLGEHLSSLGEMVNAADRIHLGVAEETHCADKRRFSEWLARRPQAVSDGAYIADLPLHRGRFSDRLFY
jgi:hypothetical protein